MKNTCQLILGFWQKLLLKVCTFSWSIKKKPTSQTIIYSKMHLIRYLTTCLIEINLLDFFSIEQHILKAQKGNKGIVH